MLTPAYALTATERVLPSMALDFTTATLDPRVTVTRALNTATRFNSSGAIEIVNANLPRFDYDPVTLLPKGLLIEELRANALTYSNDFGNAAWSKIAAGSGVTPAVTGGFTDPSGGSTAWRIQLDAGPNGASDYSLLRQSVGALATPFTRSFWAKSNTGSSQTITLVATNSSFQVTIPTTWTRLQQLQPVAGAGQLDFSVGGAGATPATADILIWNAQVETGSFATSYIPTTTTSLTRNADVVGMTGTNFSDWFAATGEGTFACSYSYLGKSPTFGIALQTDDGTNSNLIGLLGQENVSGNTQIGGYIRLSGSNQMVEYPLTTSSVGTTYTSVLAYKSNNCAIAVNTTLLPDTSVAIPTGLNILRIGSRLNEGYLNGHIKTVRYWKQRVINAEVTAFSKS
jgi:hypothetical protein